MQCYECGTAIPSAAKVCPSCGRPKSRLIYAPLCAVAGGLVGGLIGFTVGNAIGALIGGLAGIVGCELVARLIFRSRRAA